MQPGEVKASSWTRVFLDPFGQLTYYSPHEVEGQSLPCPYIMMNGVNSSPNIP